MNFYSDCDKILKCIGWILLTKLVKIFSILFQLFQMISTTLSLTFIWLKLNADDNYASSFIALTSNIILRMLFLSRYFLVLNEDPATEHGEYILQVKFCQLKIYTLFRWYQIILSLTKSWLNNMLMNLLKNYQLHFFYILNKFKFQDI